MTIVAKTYWAGAPFRFAQPPKDATVEARVLRTEDFRDVRALWWTPRDVPRPRVAIVAMHPRVDFTSHYTFPGLLAGGYGCLGALSRCEGNDTAAVHEELVLDLATCIRWLKERRGVERVVLLGNCGGGSLSALYQAEALSAPNERLATLPWGAPCRLPRATLPPADAMIYVAAHPGQGRVCLESIDPSVTDERDPLSRDPSLDMYEPRNGFAEPPTWSTYDDAFVARYRAAQRSRVERLDEHARAMLEARRDAEREMGASDFASLPLATRREIWRRADVEPVMVVHRTGASLHYTTNALDPQERTYGSLLSERPDRMNDRLLGWARTCTPESWLSTWSGLSSRADLARNVARIATPTLLVHAGRDVEILFESHVRPTWDAVRADDRTLHVIEGAGHYLEPAIPGDAARPHLDALHARVLPWLAERVGAGAAATRATTPSPSREPAASSWTFPERDRPALPAPLRRTSLRELGARSGRFEHHLVVVGRVGATQIELATASEPLAFAHANRSDEIAVALPTGDAMIDAAPLLTLVSSMQGHDVGRYRHGVSDVVLHPHGFLHWPGRLRPPYEPFAFPPGARRSLLTAVFCASRHAPPSERPLFVSAGREADAKRYESDVPMLLADAKHETARELARIEDVTLSLVVRPEHIAPPRGAYVLVLEASGAHHACDLVFVPEGASLDARGIERALVVSSPSVSAETPPSSWDEVANAPFAVAEDAERGSLPVRLGDLELTEVDSRTVRARLGDVVTDVPRHWLARMLFRVALHDFSLGWVETYGGFTYDDTADGVVRFGLRSGNETGARTSIPRAIALASVERAYRAVAPHGYVERLV